MHKCDKRCGKDKAGMWKEGGHGVEMWKSSGGEDLPENRGLEEKVPHLPLRGPQKKGKV